MHTHTVTAAQGAAADTHAERPSRGPRSCSMTPWYLVTVRCTSIAASTREDCWPTAASFH